jgi:pyruvate formate lyase activating enzyme
MDPNASPVFGILQNASMVDYPGKMAAVFFLSGCNFRCGFATTPS